MPSAPATAHEIAQSVLAQTSPDRQRSFGLRLDRWWADLMSGLLPVYGAASGQLAERLVAAAAQAYLDRPDDLRVLDERRLLQPDWLQDPRMFGYAAYADRFAGGLRGVREQLPYLRELGVTYLHLMPILTPRDGDNDGGYAVQDYRSVRPDLGTMDDLTDLATDLRAQDMSLVVDLVLNHVAREHDWAERAKAGEQRYRNYFYLFPDRAEPDAYEQTLPEIFPDFAPGSFTWDDSLRAWVWTTFNEWQWDVNWANPDVFAEYADIVLMLANKGVEVIRLDAIAFLWKRLGTDCQNQPEVHAITQALRTVCRIACPAVAFKAEAIVGPQDLVQYLGSGRHTGKVSDLAYHNSLMVQVWSMLAAGEVALAAHALGNLPPAATTGTWICYVRCHDDIGWAIDDRDAAAVGISGFAHRWFLSDWYCGLFPMSPASGLVFQENKATGDRRISGTAASLCGLEKAERMADPQAAEIAVRRILLAHTIVAGWGGIPVVWSGDELATANDPHWADDPAHADDNRWVHRPRLDWARATLRNDKNTAPGRIFQGLARLSRTRARLPLLHAATQTQALEVRDPGVFATIRRHPYGAMVMLANVTATPRPWPGWRVRELGVADPVDAITGERLPEDQNGDLWLTPYTAYWLVDSVTLG